MSNQDEKNGRNNVILLPKVDIVFKMLFGDARNKELLTDLLKSILDLPDNEYENISIVDPHLKRESTDDKLGIVDVKLELTGGKIVHIEMQVLEAADMPERITYYNSKMLVSQMKSGWSYEALQRTISIVIADFEIVSGSPLYHHIFRLSDLNAGVSFTDVVEINTLELSKLPEAPDNTKKYEWLEFLRAEREEEFDMIAQKNPIINEAVMRIKELSQDERNRMLFEDREKAIRDEMARTRLADMRGENRGKKSVAANMLTAGFPPDQIAELTGLSSEEIDKLRTKSK